MSVNGQQRLGESHFGTCIYEKLCIRVCVTVRMAGDIYGKRSLTLNLGLPWMFIIADVKKPILGTDFFRQFGPMVDINHRKVIDTTRHRILCPKNTTNTYLTLLSEFPTLTNVSSPEIHVSCNIIRTTSRQPYHQSLPIAPDCLRRNLSTYTSLKLSAPPPASTPLHMVPRRLPVTGVPVVTTAASIV